MFSLLVGFVLVVSHDIVAAEKQLGIGPIVDFQSECPDTIHGRAVLTLIVDVPGTAIASCKRGKQIFASTDNVKHFLFGSFNQSHDGDCCIFHKKQDINLFSVGVEFGWGDTEAKLLTSRKSFTVTCSYDEHGQALSKTHQVGKSYLTAGEQQQLVGETSSGQFVLELVDVMGDTLDAEDIEVGRRIRLRVTETTHTVTGFRVISCRAANHVAHYAFLRAGCGDGLVLHGDTGFKTRGAVAWSPYFLAFKLIGSDTLIFRCNFSICAGNCDGIAGTEGTSWCSGEGPGCHVNYRPRSLCSRNGNVPGAFNDCLSATLG